MDQKESSAANCIPKNLLDIIFILERDGKHHSYILYEIGIAFLSNFAPRMQNRRH